MITLWDFFQWCAQLHINIKWNICHLSLLHTHWGVLLCFNKCPLLSYIASEYIAICTACVHIPQCNLD